MDWTYSMHDYEVDVKLMGKLKKEERSLDV